MVGGVMQRSRRRRDGGTHLGAGEDGVGRRDEGGLLVGLHLAQFRAVEHRLPLLELAGAALGALGCEAPLGTPLKTPLGTHREAGAQRALQALAGGARADGGRRGGGRRGEEPPHPGVRGRAPLRSRLQRRLDGGGYEACGRCLRECSALTSLRHLFRLLATHEKPVGVERDRLEELVGEGRERLLARARGRLVTRALRRRRRRRGWRWGLRGRRLGRRRWWRRRGWQRRQWRR